MKVSPSLQEDGTLSLRIDVEPSGRVGRRHPRRMELPVAP